MGQLPKNVPKDSRYYSMMAKMGAGKSRGFVLSKTRVCKPKCPKWDVCILQEASKLYYNGCCALANQPTDLSMRIQRLLSGNPDKIKQNIVELISEADRLTKETKDPDRYFKLIDRLVKYHEILSGEKKEEKKSTSIIYDLKVAQAKSEAVDGEVESDQNES